MSKIKFVGGDELSQCLRAFRFCALSLCPATSFVGNLRCHFTLSCTELPRNHEQKGAKHLKYRQAAFNLLTKTKDLMHKRPTNEFKPPTSFFCMARVLCTRSRSAEGTSINSNRFPPFFLFFCVACAKTSEGTIILRIYL